MNLTKTTIVDGCMRSDVIRRIGTRRAGRDQKKNSTPKATLTTRRQLTKRQLTELFFENCIDCEKMATIPQGAFAACKVRCNEERIISKSTIEKKERTEKKENIFNSRPPLEGWELTPLKYNSKLMNSIWGLYNRYSVHNFKKNNDAEDVRGGVAAAIWDAILEKHFPAINVAATASVEARRIMRTENGV
ncbi:uncharacterized protein [Linepithema humile]|uniref:uncharacterized protein n=1 Tax=Linepithema humile TaxID=83485 RepID=UPI000623AF5E|nr:PREDICTED: uncharacterized protein LOC105675714 [Linepithema humile]